ncbi:hypothetical protein [Pedobacter sp. ASV12]|uniref:hypothetical protein n=1 Tax=Pedobacter sp. ASV12 TaxID=2795120 RepID=UPI0018EBC8A2|nr:hypothetical protein [Pedobacter sp. ASV12]
MYVPGNIIYFDPFYFKDGSASKPKYFLVIKLVGESVLLASLPSSVDHLPRNVEIDHGCIEIPEGNINCYVFKAGRNITSNDWCFPKNTFLYGQWLDDYEIALLNDIYPVENIDYQIIGKLTDAELANVIGCFLNSASVKRKFKRILAQNLS